MHKRNFNPWLILVFCLLVLPIDNDALGLSACYEVSDFPAASKIETDSEGRLKVFFNNRYTEPKDDGIVYMLDANREWKKEGIVTITHPQGRGGAIDGKFDSQACVSAASRVGAEIELSAEEFTNHRPRLEHVLADPEFNLSQTVASCHDTPESTLMGLGFYDGENTYGYGGIARLDKASGSLEVARNEYFADYSINSIIEYNDQIFAGTTGFYECYGLPPTSGLLLYNWDSKRVSYLVNNAICGDVIHDMAIWNDEIWVATDMGLSKGTAPADPEHASIMWRYNWKNYVPADNPDEGLREVSCKDLYHELLLDMPPSNPHIETSIDFLLKAVAKKYPLEHFFIEFVEKHKAALRELEKREKNR